MIPLKESDIARTVRDFLAAQGWRVIVTDPVSDRSRGKGFGEIGMADLLVLRYRPWPVEWHDENGWHPKVQCQAEVIWLELKRIDAKGRTTKATPAQKLWHQAERARGALVWVAGEDFEASIEGFCNFYKASGLMRRVK